MSEAAAASLPTVEAEHSFLWRRLHSLSGIVPVGAFLVFHLYENLKALDGVGPYNQAVAEINSLLPKPYFYLLELGGLILPLLYHALYGIYIAFQGERNVRLYPYGNNALYVAQRTTGIFAFFFIMYHFFSLRVGVSLATGSLITLSDVVHHLTPIWVTVFYVLGVLATEFHFANGLNGVCWSWGIAVSERSRRVVAGIAWAVFVIMAIPSVHLILNLHGQG